MKKIIILSIFSLILFPSVNASELSKQKKFELKRCDCSSCQFTLNKHIIPTYKNNKVTFKTIDDHIFDQTSKEVVSSLFGKKEKHLVFFGSGEGLDTFNLLKKIDDCYEGDEEQHLVIHLIDIIYDSTNGYVNPELIINTMKKNLSNPQIKYTFRSYGWIDKYLEKNKNNDILLLQTHACLSAEFFTKKSPKKLKEANNILKELLKLNPGKFFNTIISKVKNIEFIKIFSESKSIDESKKIKISDRKEFVDMLKKEKQKKLAESIIETIEEEIKEDDTLQLTIPILQILMKNGINSEAFKKNYNEYFKIIKGSEKNKEIIRYFFSGTKKNWCMEWNNKCTKYYVEHIKKSNSYNYKIETLILKIESEDPNKRKIFKPWKNNIKELALWAKDRLFFSCDQYL